MMEMIEPSAQERAELPDTTSEYLDDLEAENAALKHDLTRQIAIANELAQWQEEARELLASEAGEGWGPREIDEWVRRRDALLEGGSDG